MGDYSNDELDTLWLEFQRDSAADCPYCGAVVAIEILEEEHEPPKISVRCPGCGRSAIGQPRRYHPSE